MVHKLKTTAVSVAILAAGFGSESDHKPLDVRSDVVSISEIRPSAIKPESIEFQKRKLNKEEPSTKASEFSQLAKAARYEAKHGGVLCSRYACATAKMKWLVKKLIILRFAPTGASATGIVVCLARAESGLNPGTISATDDWGVGQINRPAHGSDHPEWWRPHAGFRYAVLDPVYNVGIMWSMSKRGTSWSPWTGTWGRGMCH